MLLQYKNKTRRKKTFMTSQVHNIDCILEKCSRILFSSVCLNILDRNELLRATIGRIIKKVKQKKRENRALIISIFFVWSILCFYCLVRLYTLSARQNISNTLAKNRAASRFKNVRLQNACNVLSMLFDCSFYNKIKISWNLWVETEKIER